jgi:hypothetical protein
MFLIYLETQPTRFLGTWIDKAVLDVLLRVGYHELVQFTKTKFKRTDNWIFRTATPFPDLQVGGDALLKELAASLKNELEENG